MGVLIVNGVLIVEPMELGVLTESILMVFLLGLMYIERTEDNSLFCLDKNNFYGP